PPGRSAASRRKPEGDRPLRSGGSLLLLRDDVVLDLVVGGLRDDLLLDQVVLPPVRTVVDYLLGIGLADPGEALQLVRGGAVDVERRLLLLGRRLAGSLAGGAAGFDVCASTAGGPRMPAMN